MNRTLSDPTVSIDVEVCHDVPTVHICAARRLIEDHCIPWEDFLVDFDARTTYNTREIFDWLGY